MAKVNKKFIKGMQSELDRKSEEYDGKDNPKCYKNMMVEDLMSLIDHDVLEIDIIFGGNPYYKKVGDIEIADIKKRLIAISNRCGMVWEKLEGESK